MENYVGEIRSFAGNYAPEGWAFCKGQLVSISEFEALYSLLGTTYGGDGQTSFALPNLQSRVAVGQGTSQSGTNYPIGMAAGTENVTLTSLQMPVHQHPILSSSTTAMNSDAGQASPAGAYFGDKGASAYGSGSDVQLNPGAVTGQSNVAGGSQPHANIQPVLAMNYIIALNGIYPSFD